MWSNQINDIKTQVNKASIFAVYVTYIFTYSMYKVIISLVKGIVSRDEYFFDTREHRPITEKGNLRRVSVSIFKISK
jgi:hypothetical protein